VLLTLRSLSHEIPQREEGRMNVPREPDSFEFADYLGVLRRQWWLVVLLACVGVLAGAAYLKLAPKAYTATATVNVTPTGGSQSQSGAVAGGRTTGVINLDTEAQMVQSATVAAVAAHTLHSSLAPGVLARNTSVTVPANSSVLQIGCMARSAQQAAACANAFAAGYLKNRSASAASAISSQLNAVRTQQETLQKQATQLTTQVNTLPTNSSQRSAAETQLQTVSAELKSLADQEVSLTAAATSSSGGTIITAATPPTKPSSPKPLLALPSGLLAGLLIGVVAAFILDRRGKRISNSRELDRFGPPVLLDLSGRDLGRDPVVSARSAAGLEFAELARVIASVLGENGRLLLVAGVSAGSGCEVVAANLAATLARTRPGVILVCPGDQHTPEFFGLAGAPRLDSATVAEVAAGTKDLGEVAVQLAGLSGLGVLILDPDLDELQFEQARQLAWQLRDRARYVVIEAPVATAADTFALAEFCDAALVTVEMSRAKRRQLEDRIRLLDRLRIRIVGIAAVPRLRWPTRRSRGGEAAQSRPVLGARGPEAAAAANDSAGDLKAGQPVWTPAAEQDEAPTMVLSARSRAEMADKPRGD
jgi:capsular polysaccharide biosynthesis protein